MCIMTWCYNIFSVEENLARGCHERLDSCARTVRAAGWSRFVHPSPYCVPVMMAPPSFLFFGLLRFKGSHACTPFSSDMCSELAQFMPYHACQGQVPLVSILNKYENYFSHPKYHVGGGIYFHEQFWLFFL
jgi:hypothetical protein